MPTPLILAPRSQATQNPASHAPSPIAGGNQRNDATIEDELIAVDLTTERDAASIGTEARKRIRTVCEKENDERKR